MATTGVVEAWKRADPPLTEPMMRWAVASDVTSALLDLDDGRLAARDDAGIDTAVLSLTTPGVQSLAPAQAVALQEPANDAIAAAVGRRPERLQGFAALAMPAPAPYPDSWTRADQRRRTRNHCVPQPGKARRRHPAVSSMLHVIAG